jgi:hypothetical protein
MNILAAPKQNVLESTAARTSGRRRLKACEPRDRSGRARHSRRTQMLRNAITALLALGVVCAISPTTAAAGGGHGSGGLHHGGFHGGGFGFYAPYGYGYPYGYIPYYGDAGVCYEERQRVKMRYGWRIRRVSICE